VVVETRSTNTKENFANIGPWLKERGIEKIIIVTSLVHLRWALFTAKKQPGHLLPELQLQGVAADRKLPERLVVTEFAKMSKYRREGHL